jgi:acetylglutamate kinase
LKRLGKESTFIAGQRVTDAETLEVVEMVLGKINKDIVALINQYGGKAVGLSGKDGQLIEARKSSLIARTDNGEVTVPDLGFVGEVARINPEIIETVITQGYILVVTPIGIGAGGESYNINADYVAGEIATALNADKLVLLTDVEGILAKYGDNTSLLSTIKVDAVPGLIESGVISGGMIPKVECCVQAVRGGVSKTHIIDGRLPHSILLEVFTDQGIGTMVVE